MAQKLTVNAGDARARFIITSSTSRLEKGQQAGFLRSGTTLSHDNQLTGIEVSQLCRFANYRETPSGLSSWGIADGTSPWDANDTEGNGTYVEGHPPHLFDSGTDTSSVNSQGVIHDSSKNWTPNQWVGYSIKNTNPASGSNTLGSYIISNTSNTITYNYYEAPDTGAHLCLTPEILTRFIGFSL